MNWGNNWGPGARFTASCIEREAMEACWNLWASAKQTLGKMGFALYSGELRRGEVTLPLPQSAEEAGACYDALNGHGYSAFSISKRYLPLSGEYLALLRKEKEEYKARQEASASLPQKSAEERWVEIEAEEAEEDAQIEIEAEASTSSCPQCGHLLSDEEGMKVALFGEKCPYCSLEYSQARGVKKRTSL